MIECVVLRQVDGCSFRTMFDDQEAFMCFDVVEVIVAVTCRTCGVREFPLCLNDLSILISDLDEDMPGPYCTEAVKRHEIVAVMGAWQPDKSPTEDAGQGW